MKLNRHSDVARLLEGTHAFLSPSSPAWANYDEDKLSRVYFASEAARRGTELHEFANRAIRLRINLPETSSTLNMYVNDAIGYRMSPEQLLFYSDNCYGHADTLSFHKDFLRVHDLKTGTTATSMLQLEIYIALFCLEYNKLVDPFKIQMEARIYQNDTIKVHNPDPSDIFQLMDTIVSFDKRINYLRAEDPV